MKVCTSAARVCAAALVGLLILTARADAQIISSGTITANNGVRVQPMVDLPALGVDLTGTWSATVNFYESATEDCATATRVIPAFRTSDQTFVTTATANSLFSIANLGYRFVCVKATPFTSGTITVTFMRGLVTPPSSVSVSGVTVGDVTSGGANIATQTTAASIDTKTPALGQTTMAGSQPVAIASNQSALPVTSNGANLATQTTVASIDTKTPALGQATMAASQPVAIASNQSAVPVTSNGANLATQTTLASVDNKIPALGQAAMAASSPVAISSDQTQIPVTCSGCLAESTTPTVLQNAVTADNTGVATSMDVSSRSFAMGTVTITGTAVVTWKARQDATNYHDVYAVQAGVPNPTRSSTVSTVGTTFWRMNVAGEQRLLADVDCTGACTVTVTVTALVSPTSPLQYSQPIPSTSKRIITLTNTSQDIKTSSGVLTMGFCSNPNASESVVQLYDTAGAVTVGTTTPAGSFPLPAGAAGHLIETDIAFSAGIKVAASTTVTGGSAPSSSLTCFFGYR